MENKAKASDHQLLDEINKTGIEVSAVRFFVHDVEKIHVGTVLNAILDSNRVIEICDNNDDMLVLENVQSDGDRFSFRFIKPSSKETAANDLRTARELILPVLSQWSGRYDGPEFRGMQHGETHGRAAGASAA